MNKDSTSRSNNIRSASQADFTAYAQGLSSRLVPLTALFVAMTTVLFWPLDFLVFEPGSPYSLSFARMRLGFLTSAGLTVITFFVFRTARRYGALALFIMTIACVASAAFTVGQVWDSSSGMPAPWLYSAYLLPLVTLPAVVDRWTRIAMTGGVTFGGLALFRIADSHFLEQQLVGLPLATVFFSCLLSVGIGEVIYRLLRSNYEKRMLLEQDREQLRTVVKSLEGQLMRNGSALERMTNSLERARKQERLHLSREIHDELGQLLSGLRIETALVKKHTGNSDKVEHFLSTIDGLLGQALGAVDAIIKGLRYRTADAEEQDLAATIRAAIADFRRRTGLTCRFIVADEEFGLDKDKLAEVYRIVQESLTNVMRHAAAQSVEVRCDHLGEALLLTVSDDGRGFRSSRLEDLPRHGVLGMKERARVLGGRLRVNSEQGQGTTVRLEVPLSAGAS